MLELVEEEYESLPDDPEMQKEFSNIRVRIYHNSTESIPIAKIPKNK